MCVVKARGRESEREKREEVKMKEKKKALCISRWSVERGQGWCSSYRMGSAQCGGMDSM